MSPARLEVGNTLQAMRFSFEENRDLILRVTVLFAVLNTAAALLDIAGPFGTAISFGITILFGAVYSGMVVAVICLPGKKEGIGELWGIVKPVLARVVWVTLLTALLVALGLILLIIPGLIVGTLLCVAVPAAVVERTSVMGALSRSLSLVQDNGIRVFLFLLVIGLISAITFLISFLIAAPFGTGIGGTLVLTFLSNLISAPIIAVGSAVLFTQLVELHRTNHPEGPETGLPE